MRLAASAALVQLHETLEIARDVGLALLQAKSKFPRRCHAAVLSNVCRRLRVAAAQHVTGEHILGAVGKAIAQCTAAGAPGCSAGSARPLFARCSASTSRRLLNIAPRCPSSSAPDSRAAGYRWARFLPPGAMPRMKPLHFGQHISAEIDIAKRGNPALAT